MEENYDLQEGKKTFSKLGIVLLIGAVVMELLQRGTIWSAHKLIPTQMENGSVSLIVGMLPAYLIAMPLIIYMLSKLPGKELEKKSIKWYQFLGLLPMCYAIMIISNIVGLLITFAIGLVKGAAVDNVMLDIVGGVNPVVRFFIMVICAPIYEELIFRKMIVSRTIKYGTGVAMVTSGLMFGLFHGNFNQFAYAFMLGTFLAFIYAKYGDIRITMGIHMFINLMGGMVGASLLDLIDYEKLLELQRNSAGTEELTQFMMDHAVGFVIYFVLLFFIFALVVSGVVLMIIFHKKFSWGPGEVQVPKGQRFATVVLNLGMILYLLYWVVMIILQLVL